MEFDPATLDEAAQVIHSFECKVAMRLKVEGIDYERDDVFVFDLSDLEEAIEFLLIVGLTQKNAGLSYVGTNEDIVIYKEKA